MKKLHKWNISRRQYEEYLIPDNWNVSTYETDMNKIVNCAQCGKELCFGKCYTSKKIHTSIGFGYGVCEECYQQELKDENII